MSGDTISPSPFRLRRRKDMSFCKVCGKELTGRQVNYCSKKCNKLGSNRRKYGLPEDIRPKRSHLKWSDQDIQDRINSKSSKMIYIGGYVDSESFMYLQCTDCGQPFRWSARGLRKQSPIQCDNCREILSSIKEKEHQDVVNQNKINRHNEILKKRIDAKKRCCRQCGKEFYANRHQYLFCSEECRKKLQNKQHEIKRRIKIKAALVDSDITLDKLIIRDKNKCWLCGGKTNRADYIMHADGWYEAGPTHPSIDHVRPLAEGGKHSWDNVRLAHLICNERKGSNLTVEKKNGQMVFVI